MPSLKPGDPAPDFELRSHRGGTVRLSDYRGKKNVVLAFHPLAFTPVCSTQMRAYESDRLLLESRDTVVFGISTDPQPAKTAWADTLGSVSFHLLSDFHPHGRVAQQYHVFREADGISERAVYIVGKDGRIAWVRVYAIPDQPDNADLLQALDALG